MNGYNFTFALISLATLAGLIYFASLGVIAAIVTLVVLFTILLVGIGAGIALAITRMMADKAQRSFIDNAQENLTIMAALQRIQNQQNQTLLQQLGIVAKLPAPQSNPVDSLLIEEGIFEEIEK
ncbi:MAG: hypothetical protein KJ077_27345 [Anaerolineae bacterium]|nr:hypothetical protein [Anaerolineae bacterium]